MSAIEHLQLQMFDPADYPPRYQGGKVTTSREERDENDQYMTQQQQQESWFRRYKR